MSDIKNIKEWLVKVDLGNWIAQDDCPDCSGNGFKLYNDESGYERDECHCLMPESRVFNANAHLWMESLITTIESLQKENSTICPIADFDVITSLRAELAHTNEQLESQKEEIESLQDAFEMLPPKDVLIHERTKYEIDKTISNLLINNLRKDIESLKAITELAVKGFKDILSMYMLWIDSDLDCDRAATNMDTIAETTLFKIERLTHE